MSRVTSIMITGVISDWQINEIEKLLCKVTMLKKSHCKFEELSKYSVGGKWTIPDTYLFGFNYFNTEDFLEGMKKIRKKYYERTMSSVWSIKLFISEEEDRGWEEIDLWKID